MGQTCTQCSVSKLALHKTSADTCAVVVAGGSGERFGNPRGKQFVSCAGLPLISWSILAFDRAPSVGAIVVVCAKDRFAEMSAVLSELILTTPVRLAPAGNERQDSCASGLANAPADLPFVAFHDAARPLILVETIEACIARLRADVSLDGTVCGQPAIDTLKVADGDISVSTPDRSTFWFVQTPQIFRREAILQAHAVAAIDGFVGTDDASLVEHADGRVALVRSQRDNIKVTLPEDLATAEAILTARLTADAFGEL